MFILIIAIVFMYITLGFTMTLAGLSHTEYSRQTPGVLTYVTGMWGVYCLGVYFKGKGY